MSEQAFADSVKYAIRISHTEEGWIQPLLDAVKDVDYQMAKWKPAPEVASIWEIVAHAVPYTESRICDFTGDRYPNEPDWPPVRSESEADWLDLKQRAESAASKLQVVVDAASTEELALPVPGKKTSRLERLMDIAIHDAYHAGQIVKLQQTYSALAVRA